MTAEPPNKIVPLGTFDLSTVLTSFVFYVYQRNKNGLMWKVADVEVGGQPIGAWKISVTPIDAPAEEKQIGNA